MPVRSSAAIENLPGVLKDIKVLRKAVGTELRPSILNGMAFEGRRGALEGMRKDFSVKPASSARKGIVYNRYTPARGASEIVVKKSAGRGKKKSVRDFPSLINGETISYKSKRIDRRLILPVPRDQRTVRGRLKKSTRQRVLRLASRVSTKPGRWSGGRKMEFYAEKDGIAIFDVYQQARENSFKGGRRLLAYAPDRVRYKKNTFGFYKHVNRGVNRRLARYTARELEKFVEKYG